MDWRSRQLLDRHRRRQVTIGVQVDSLIRRQWATLDITDIDVARGQVMASVTQRATSLRALSAKDADMFIRRMRELETGSTAGFLERADARLSRSALGALEGAGPIGFKQRITKGIPDEVAFLAARDQMMAEARKIIMEAGRDTIRLSAEGNTRSIGWRRVSDGNPCAFCAMLVGRGPVYQSDETAGGVVEGHYHNKCGCTAVEVFTTWEPTDREKVFVDAYMDAAEAADRANLPRTWENTLPFMRDNGKFRDSPVVRNKRKTT